MSTDTPEQRAEASPEWAPLPPTAPKPPRDPKRLALLAGAVTLAVILIATTVFALRGASRSTTANTIAPTATTAPTASTAPTATTVPTATPAPGTAPAAPVSVYFAASNGGQSTVYAVNPADGTTRWQSNALQSKVNNGSVFSLTLSDNIVYALGFSGPLVALQALDGKELWRVDTHFTFSPSVADAGVVYVASQGDSINHGFVDAYRASDGKLLWEQDTGLNGRAQIGASGGTLYVNAAGSLSARRGADGTILWQVSLNAPITVDPVVVDGTIYFNNYGEVFAFKAADGSLRWHYRPQQLFGEGATTLAVGGGFIFAGSGTSVIALHEADGTLAWSKAYPRLVLGTSYSDGVMYVSWEDPSLPALRATDGAQLWSAQLIGGHAWPAVVAGRTIFVGMNPGATPNGAPAYVYALRPTDGSVMWSITATQSGGVSAPVVA